MIFGWALLGVLFLILGSVCPDEGWAFFVFYVAALLCAVVVVGFSFSVLFGAGCDWDC